jgi:23S rRNA pseudouridine2605 synthase
MTIRLNKLLAQRGIGARRKCDTLIQEGAVRVNGRVIREPGTQVEADRDRIQVKGQPLPGAAELRYFALNKPVGVITTLEDPEGRRTIRDFMPPRPRLFPVGRLDADTSGLLLLTNDGELAHHLMHPRYGVEKSYRVTLDHAPSPDQLRRLRSGVEFEPGVVSAPAEARVLDPAPGRAVLGIRIHEGRYRQVRRMCEALGLGVLALHRAAYGPLRLGMLARGMWRELSEEEIGALRAAGARPTRGPGSGHRAPAGGRRAMKRAASDARAARFGGVVTETDTPSPGSAPIVAAPPRRPGTRPVSRPPNRSAAPLRAGRLRHAPATRDRSPDRHLPAGRPSGREARPPVRGPAAVRRERPAAIRPAPSSAPRRPSSRTFTAAPLAVAPTIAPRGRKARGGEPQSFRGRESRRTGPRPAGGGGRSAPPRGRFGPEDFGVPVRGKRSRLLREVVSSRPPRGRAGRPVTSEATRRREVPPRFAREERERSARVRPPAGAGRREATLRPARGRDERAVVVRSPREARGGPTTTRGREGRVAPRQASSPSSRPALERAFGRVSDRPRPKREGAAPSRAPRPFRSTGERPRGAPGGAPRPAGRPARAGGSPSRAGSSARSGAPARASRPGQFPRPGGRPGATASGRRGGPAPDRRRRG